MTISFSVSPNDSHDYDKEESDNPYTGIDAEYWSDGWEDASDNESQ